MKKISILALLLLLATLCFGQAPKAALYNSNSDVYAGFIVTCSGLWSEVEQL